MGYVFWITKVRKATMRIVGITAMAIPPSKNEGKRNEKIKRLEVSQNPSPKEKWFFSKKPSPIKMKIGSTAVTINEFWGCESG